MKTIQFEVLPDDAGGWNVTRDRVVTAGFDHKPRAEHHAMACCLAASISGTAARLTVMGRDGRPQQERSFAPRRPWVRPTVLRSTSRAHIRTRGPH